VQILTSAEELGYHGTEQARRRTLERRTGCRSRKARLDKPTIQVQQVTPRLVLGRTEMFFKTARKNLGTLSRRLRGRKLQLKNLQRKRLGKSQLREAAREWAYCTLSREWGPGIRHARNLEKKGVEKKNKENSLAREGSLRNTGANQRVKSLRDLKKGVQSRERNMNDKGLIEGETMHVLREKSLSRYSDDTGIRTSQNTRKLERERTNHSPVAGRQ